MSNVAITGIGVIAPGRPGREAFWDLISNGRTATRKITSFDASTFRSQIAAECEFDAYDCGLSGFGILDADRVNQMAVASALEARLDAGRIGSNDRGRVGVVVGSAVGCTVSLEREYLNVSHHATRWLVDQKLAGRRLYDHLVPSSIVRDVAWAIAAEGPVRMVSNGCTSGLDVARHAIGMLENCDLDAVIVVGADAPISPITVACFDAIMATSANNDDPAHASRPFDLNRDGFVLGEGAAALVLEPLDLAERRGARVYAELRSAESRANAHHMTGLKSDGREMGEAITSALAKAGIRPEEVDYVNAHGSGTKQNDRHETAAFKLALGECANDVAISSIKSMVGHSLGAIGTIELAACAMAVHNQFIPPTANYCTPDPACDLDYVPNIGRSSNLRTVVSVGSGFGGFQSAVTLTTAGWSK